MGASPDELLTIIKVLTVYEKAIDKKHPDLSFNLGITTTIINEPYGTQILY